MNNERRNQITSLIRALGEEGVKAELEHINLQLEELAGEEQKEFDNLPEASQNSERGEAIRKVKENIEEAIEFMECLIANIDDVIDELNKAKG